MRQKPKNILARLQPNIGLLKPDTKSYPDLDLTMYKFSWSPILYHYLSLLYTNNSTMKSAITFVL
jgi:hypothetical protein